MKVFLAIRILTAALALLLIGHTQAESQQPADSIPTGPTRAAPAEGPAEPPFSPRGAFFRSAILPGWGQAYVGAPGRGAVYFALASGSFLMTYTARRQLDDARARQDWLRETGALQEDVESPFVLSRERHFEDWAALSLFMMFLAGADAYVSAYLADFDERIGVMPTPDGALQLQMTLPARLAP